MQKASHKFAPVFVASVAETPFGGVKGSGYRREGGTEGLRCYTVTKNGSHKMIQRGLMLGLTPRGVGSRARSTGE